MLNKIKDFLINSLDYFFFIMPYALVIMAGGSLIYKFFKADFNDWTFYIIALAIGLGSILEKKEERKRVEER